MNDLPANQGPEGSGVCRRHYAALHDSDDATAMAAARSLGDEARARQIEVVVVSACLLGERTRYDGGAKHRPDLVDPLRSDPARLVLPLCPEILGGMGCPRPAVHFASGDGEALRGGGDARVVDAAGRDHTEALDAGARRAEKLALAAGATRALLKEHSPSCGVHRVHGVCGVQKGRGAFAARWMHLGYVAESDGDGPSGNSP